MQLDAPQCVLLTLRAGRTRIARGALTLAGAGAAFWTRDAEVLDDGACAALRLRGRAADGAVAAAGGAAVECGEDALHVRGVARGRAVRVRVPHAYHAGAEPLVRRACARRGVC